MAYAATPCLWHAACCPAATSQRCAPPLLCPTHRQVLDKTRTRKLMQAIASLGPAVCLVKLAADQVRFLSSGVCAY